LLRITKLLFLLPLVHPLLQTSNTSEVGSDALRLREIRPVRREVHAPGGFIGGDALLPKVGNPADEVAQVALERGD
jgi:hypothetical protein